MVVWIVNVGENLPTDGENTRIFRCGILANYSSERGHTVVWWTSTFDHYLKKHRFTKDIDIELKKNYKIKFLYGVGYKKNISLKRLYDHYVLGKKLKKYAEKEVDKPDVILTSYPTISLTDEAVKYGKKFKVPVIVDVRDLWPEIFVAAIQKKIQFLGSLFLYPMYRKTRRIFENSYGITGMTNEFVSWGLNFSKRKLTLKDKPFPFGYEKNIYTQKQIDDANSFWDTANLNANSFNIAIVSSIAYVFDVDFLLKVASLIQEKGIKVKFIICGVGILFDDLKKKSEEFDSIKLMGWVDGCQIASLLSRSTLGFIPYHNRKDFMMSIPNKVPEYMSQGLPVITSLKGVVQDIVEQNNCGYYVNSAEKMVEVIESIISNPEENNRKKENSIRYFDENFNSKKVYNDMVDYLEFISVNFKKEKR